jgi:hypothetical protein
LQEFFMFEKTMADEVHGTVGEIYVDSSSLTTVDEAVEDNLVDNGTPEGTRGWYQINPTQRVLVRRVRISHSMCIWKEVKPLPSGMAH